jgi:hypothetical protein
MVTSSTAMRIVSSDQKLEFYDYNLGTFIDQGENSYYFDTASLIGAITVDDVTIYNDIIRRAFRRASHISQIYLEKMKILESRTQDRACNLYYAQAESYLQSQFDIFSDMSYGSNKFESTPEVKSKIDDLMQAKQRLVDTNKGTIKYTCSLIY